jgi:predicted AlkP superfamily pyrophosphatase or phosphodiesterase
MQQAKQIQFFDVWFTHCLLLFYAIFILSLSFSAIFLDFTILVVLFGLLSIVSIAQPSQHVVFISIDGLRPVFYRDLN